MTEQSARDRADDESQAKSRPEQAQNNAAVSNLPALSEDLHASRSFPSE